MPETVEVGRQAGEMGHSSPLACLPGVMALPLADSLCRMWVHIAMSGWSVEVRTAEPKPDSLGAGQALLADGKEHKSMWLLADKPQANCEHIPGYRRSNV